MFWVWFPARTREQMQERARMRWSSYTISSDTLLENHTYFKYIHTCLTLSTTYHSLLLTGSDVPPLLNLKLANSMSASNHLPTDVRRCLVACAVNDSTQVVKEVALFVCLGDKHVQIASSFLPIQTRWGQSSRPEAGFASLLDPDGSAKRTGWLSGDWCCFYYFRKNGLVAMLETLYAWIHTAPVCSLSPSPYHHTILESNNPNKARLYHYFCKGSDSPKNCGSHRRAR